MVLKLWLTELKGSCRVSPQWAPSHGPDTIKSLVPLPISLSALLPLYTPFWRPSLLQLYHCWSYLLRSRLGVMTQSWVYLSALKLRIRGYRHMNSVPQLSQTSSLLLIMSPTPHNMNCLCMPHFSVTLFGINLKCIHKSGLLFCILQGGNSLMFLICITRPLKLPRSPREFNRQKRLFF